LTKLFSELQALYLAGIENMSADDARAFLDLLSSDPDAPFRDTRIPILEHHLSQIERMSEAELAWERTWKAAAYEYIALTERWLKLGANWRPIGTALTVWEYEGERFYQWWSRSLITDNIEEARKADAKLSEIIKRKEASE